MSLSLSVCLSSLSQLFVFLFVLSVAVFVIRDRFCKKKEEKKEKSPFVLKSLSLFNKVLSYPLSFSPLFVRSEIRLQLSPVSFTHARWSGDSSVVRASDS